MAKIKAECVLPRTISRRSLTGRSKVLRFYFFLSQCSGAGGVHGALPSTGTRCKLQKASTYMMTRDVADKPHTPLSISILSFAFCLSNPLCHSIPHSLIPPPISIPSRLLHLSLHPSLLFFLLSSSLSLPSISSPPTRLLTKMATATRTTAHKHKQVKLITQKMSQAVDF